jgi:hypothetical protein
MVSRTTNSAEPSRLAKNAGDCNRSHDSRVDAKQVPGGSKTEPEMMRFLRRLVAATSHAVLQAQAEMHGSPSNTRKPFMYFF